MKCIDLPKLIANHRGAKFLFLVWLLSLLAPEWLRGEEGTSTGDSGFAWLHEQPVGTGYDHFAAGRIPEIIDESVIDLEAPQVQLASYVAPAFPFAPSNIQPPVGSEELLAINPTPYSGVNYSIDALARAYYFNDQRQEWSGQEATFFAEAAVLGSLKQTFGNWETSLVGEFYLNQPYDRNIYDTGRERASFRANYEVEPFEMSQLYISARNGDFYTALGKFVTPFGRTYFPLYRNERDDAPFIRTESILWRETGLLLQYDPGPLVITAALTNGSEDGDTNSSKAGMFRIGYQNDWTAFGVSVKTQDGIGSEEKKLTNNHVGVDAMVRHGRWSLSGEAIWDEYGFRREFDPNDITWGRSIYYRDQYIGPKESIHGMGWYANLQYQFDPFFLMLNYGEYYPQQIGVRLHDQVNRRFLAKGVWQITPNLEMYLIGLRENDVERAQEGRKRIGAALITGFQYSL